MRRAALFAVATLAVLAACDDGTEPAAPPTSEDALTTATAAPADDDEVTSEAPDAEATTEEPDASGPPEMPAEATEQTEAGAEAFVEHYVQALDQAYATGSAESAESLGSRDCDSCSALLQDIPSNPEAEPTFEHVNSTATLLGEDLARVETTMTVLRGEGVGEGDLVFDLARTPEDGWIVDSIRIQSGT